MKRLLLVCFMVLVLAGYSSAIINVIGSGSTAAVGDGVIGVENDSGSATESANIAYFSQFTTGAGGHVAGNVRYGHVKISAADVNETICLSLQADSDGGTVHLSGSKAAVASGWLNIDMVSTFELQDATTYRLVTQQDLAYDIVTSAWSTGTTRQDNAHTINCGSAVDNDANQSTGRYINIIFNNSAGSP